MKNVQVIDGADNAAFSIFQVTDEEFRLLFPGIGQDLEIAETAYERLGKKRADELFGSIWKRPILKADVHGLHGTLFFNYFVKRQYLPKSRREIDRAEGQINQAQRELYHATRKAVASTSAGEASAQMEGGA